MQGFLTLAGLVLKAPFEGGSFGGSFGGSYGGSYEGGSCGARQTIVVLPLNGLDRSADFIAQQSVACIAGDSWQAVGQGIKCSVIIIGC